MRQVAGPSVPTMVPLTIKGLAKLKFAVYTKQLEKKPLVGRDREIKNGVAMES